jgi:hypothetical protein
MEHGALRITRRWLFVAAAALVVIATTIVLTPREAQANEASAYVSRINGLRSSRGLATLQVDGNLSSLAQSWANHLATIGQLQHASDLSAGLAHGGWTKLGENVGVGSSVDSVFTAFVNSPAHYANLVDPSFTHVGVGVAYAGGRHFTVHRFMALPGGAPPPPPPPPPPRPSPPPPPPTSSPPATAPLAVGAPADDDAVPEPLDEPPPGPEPARVAAVLDALHATTS